MNRMIGKQSVSFTDPPYILGEASVCGPKEADGPLAGYFDIVSEDPTEALHTPKIEKKLPEILSVEEVDRLLKQPDIRTPKGIRDNAMMELLYATGMRVSELIQLKVNDVNLSACYVHCQDRSKERVIPFGSVAQKALRAMWYAMTVTKNVSSRSEMSAGMQFCNIWSIPEAFLQKIQKRVHCLQTARGNP